MAIIDNAVNLFTLLVQMVFPGLLKMKKMSEVVEAAVNGKQPPPQPPAPPLHTHHKRYKGCLHIVRETDSWYI